MLISLSEYSRVYFSGSGRNIDLLIYGALIMIIAAYCPGGINSLVWKAGRRSEKPPAGEPLSAGSVCIGALLQVSDISVSFGGLAALNNVSFSVANNEILGIVGPNGAGKSTLFGAICGDVAAGSGEIRLNGRTLNGKSSHDIARLGLVRTFQTPRPFSSMTFLEGVAVARAVQVATPAA